MKKILYLSILTLILGACDTLEQEPTTAVSTSTAITSVGDLSYAVNGAYYIASSGGQMSPAAEMAVYADVIGPDSDVKNGSGQFCQKLHERSVTPKDSYNTYYYLYKAIANVNKALEAAEQIDDPAKAPYIAELYGMRGLFHLQLATFYAPIPTSGSNNKLGIVLSTEVYDISSKAGRASLDDTYAQIVEDFTTCINDPAVNTEVSDGHINKWAALALRARAYLYWGKNAEALEDAKTVISKSPYKLYTIDNYVKSWSIQDGCDEMIMQYIQNDEYNAQRYNPGYYTHPDGYTEYLVTAEFYDFMQANTNDIRSKMVAYRETENGKGVNGYYPMKYIGKTGSTVPLYANNIKICRLSEMYLIAAEAAFKTNSTDAVGYLNTLRKNRIAGYVPAATTSIDDIINERRKELFAEGQIAFDYWRNGKSFKCGPTTYEPSNYKNVLPIPQDEIDVCGSDILMQNPGF